MRKLTLWLFVWFLGTSSWTAFTQIRDWSIDNDGKRKFRYMHGDPTNTRWYELDNQLTVFISVNKAEPRVETAIAVRAGSKHDPETNTGLAHYLEHMLFKGTDKFGTRNYTEEKKYLDEIENLYEKYNHTTDPEKRKQIYHQIDSISNIAAKVAIPNEYDKMVSAIGATGTNAYTSFEQTVYVNNIPTNEIERWLKIEGERFRAPVLRLFHTELEAVYEEKNISLDNDNRRVNEVMLANLFKNHHYGTQTTIGTVEHLKNPSLSKIKEYFQKYYVPNNMAIIISGDVDPAATMDLIEKNFGWMTPKPIEPYKFKPEDPITSPIVKTVSGPDAESVLLGFRLPGIGKDDYYGLTFIDALLSNSTAGLIDLNLVQQQKVLSAASFIWDLQDYSIHFLQGKPRKGQDLAEVSKLLLDQLEKIKQGQFEERLMKAVLKNMMIERTRSFLENKGRIYALVDAYTSGRGWENYLATYDYMQRYNKDKIMEIAKKYYGQNYVMVIKKNGPKDEIVKVPKPEITPLPVNREEQSRFTAEIFEKTPAAIKPEFINYKTDIVTDKTQKGIPILYKKNDENNLFNLYYIFDLGKNHDKKLAFAIKYLEYLGSGTMSAEQFKMKMYELACDFGVSSTDDQSYVYLRGPEDSFEEALKLFEGLLANPKPDEAALKNLIEGELKRRTDLKLNKGAILQQAMMNYAAYGSKSPFTDILKAEELKTLTAAELITKIKQLTTFQHRILYFGQNSVEKVRDYMNKYHQTPATLTPLPKATTYVRQDMTNPSVIFVNYEMVQAELLWVYKSKDYTPELVPTVSMYNEYFGSGMSSVVFQTIREAKALAYSTRSVFRIPTKKEDPFYNIAYVGTQADKMNDAFNAMEELLNGMPLVEKNYQIAKASLKNQLETNRIIREDVLLNFENAKKLGLDYDIREKIYAALDGMRLNDIHKFQEEYVSKKPYTLLVLGSKDRVDMKKLNQYGKVTVLTLEEVFGY